MNDQVWDEEAKVVLLGPECEIHPADHTRDHKTPQKDVVFRLKRIWSRWSVQF